MMKRDELADPTSCLNKAHDHEWLFVLLGRDKAAPAAVRAWIAARLSLGLNDAGDAKIRDGPRGLNARNRSRRADPMTDDPINPDPDDGPGHCTECGAGIFEDEPGWEDGLCEDCAWTADEEDDAEEWEGDDDE